MQEQGMSGNYARTKKQWKQRQNKERVITTPGQGKSDSKARIRKEW